MIYTPIAKRIGTDTTLSKLAYIPVSQRGVIGNRSYTASVSAYSLEPAQTDIRWWEGAENRDLRKDLAAGNPVVA